MTLHQILQELGLCYMAKELDDFIAASKSKRWTPLQTLEEFAKRELDEKKKRSLEKRLARSKLGRFKLMDTFDWNWPKKIARPLVEDLLTLKFMEAHENVVLLASHGLGKSMIAKNLAYQAVLKGHTAAFLTASELLLDLQKRDSIRALNSRLNYYERVGLLVIDEFGYVPYDDSAADLLYHLVDRRYEKASLVLTTNKAFSEWPTVFPNATSATALIDRMIHHAEIVKIEGGSFRKREAEERQKQRRAKTKGKK